MYLFKENEYPNEQAEVDDVEKDEEGDDKEEEEEEEEEGKTVCSKYSEGDYD